MADENFPTAVQSQHVDQLFHRIHAIRAPGKIQMFFFVRKNCHYNDLTHSTVDTGENQLWPAAIPVVELSSDDSSETSTDSNGSDSDDEDEAAGASRLRACGPPSRLVVNPSGRIFGSSWALFATGV